jgi:acyl dehydratase
MAVAKTAARYAEDYRVGEIVDVGEYTLTKEEIIAFAQTWDPQPFHLDEQAAAATMFGGLLASGWHVALIMMRMMLRSEFISAETSLGSPGLDGLKWLMPVRPGDRLSGTVEVTNVRLSRSKPGIGFVTTVARLRNQSNEEVYWLNSTAIIKSRGSAPV